MTRTAKGMGGAAIVALMFATACALGATLASVGVLTPTPGGSPASGVYAISSDGSYAVGYSNGPNAAGTATIQQPIIWSQATGLLQLPNPANTNAQARGVVIRWTSGRIGVSGNIGNRMQYYEALPTGLAGGMWTETSYGSGSLIGAFNTARLQAGSTTEAWFNAGQSSSTRGLRFRADPEGYADYRNTGTVFANSPSTAGPLVGWDSGNPNGAHRAIFMNQTNGTVQTVIRGGSGVRSEGFGISSDGTMLSGFDAADGANSEAFVWKTGDGVMTLLGKLAGDTQSCAIAVNGARTAGGYSSNSTSERAVIWDTTGVWDTTGQPRLVSDVLAAAGVDLGNWTKLARITSLSDDGRTIGGWGVWAADGSIRGFVASIPLIPNLPPDVASVGPANGARLGAVTVPLTVHVTDPEQSTMEVKFYGRPVTGPPLTPFRIVALPDTQYYSAYYPLTFSSQTQWIFNNREALNIAYVSHLGDIVDDSDQTSQWDNANNALSILDTVPALPYGLTVGNHDEYPSDDPNGTTTFNSYFPYTRYESRPWYGGHCGSNNDNHYVLFSAGGMDFIAIHLKYDPSADADVLSWAGNLLQTHGERWGIVSVHYLVGTGNPAVWSPQGQATYDALKAYPNLFLMLCGHVAGEGQRTDIYCGNTVHTLLSDYQDRGDVGWLRIMEFDPGAHEIRVKTYSPVRNLYESDANSQFTLPYFMTGVPFAEQATSTDVASGTSVTFTWTNLEADKTYEWYATATDGHTLSRSSTWSFSTTPPCVADLDLDGDVDQLDVAMFRRCMTGPSTPYGYPGQLPPDCELLPDVNGNIAADFDGDGDVDQSDFGALQRCLSGEGQLPPRSCIQ